MPNRAVFLDMDGTVTSIRAGHGRDPLEKGAFALAANGRDLAAVGTVQGWVWSEWKRSWKDGSEREAGNPCSPLKLYVGNWLNRW